MLIYIYIYRKNNPTFNNIKEIDTSESEETSLLLISRSQPPPPKTSHRTYQRSTPPRPEESHPATPTMADGAMSLRRQG